MDANIERTGFHQGNFRLTGSDITESSIHITEHLNSAASEKKKYLHLKRAELKVPMLGEKCVVHR